MAPLMTLARPALAVSLALATAACGTADKLSQVGQTPALSAIQDPTTTAGYRPVQMPMPTPQSVHYNSNSLWRSGARAFFKDQRAARVGDILTVMVTISDKAEFDNQTQRSRTGTSSSGTGGAVGAAINTLFLPSGTSADNLVSAEGGSTFQGSGKVDREEKLRTKVAAVVTQILPNGNMVIEGRQEIRVNFEVRELIVARRRPPRGHRRQQHDRKREDRRGTHRLRWPRPDHRRATAALRRPGAGHRPALLTPALPVPPPGSPCGGGTDTLSPSRSTLPRHRTVGGHGIPPLPSGPVPAAHLIRMNPNDGAAQAAFSRVASSGWRP